MFQNQDGDITLFGGISITTFILLIIGGIIVLGMWGCPRYSVYSAQKDGEAQLAHARSSKEVAVAEAKAKMEAATYEAQADTIRAQGIAASNRIIGKSLEDNPAYLQWLFIDQLSKTQNQVIYVPSGNGGVPLPIQEASRFDHPVGK